MNGMSDSYNEFKRQLLASNKVVIFLDYLIQDGFSYQQATKFLRLLYKDSDFFLLNPNAEIDSWLFVHLKIIFVPFIEINLRPFGIFINLISPIQLHNFIKMKLGIELGDIDIQRVIDELSDFGLVKLVNGGYCFPIHHLLKHIKRIKYIEETSLMLNQVLNSYKTGKRHLTHVLNYAYDSTLNILKTLKIDEEKVITLRYGLKNGDRLILESIGQLMGLTRERVRQIESAALHRLRHPTRLNRLKTSYYLILNSNKGNLLIPKNISHIHLNSIVLLFHILGVPFYEVDEGLIIGAELLPADCFNKTMLWNKKVDSKMIHEQLNQIGCWWVGDEDTKWIIENVQIILQKKQLKIHRIYLALKDLGKPSHFSEIALKHNEIFPEYHNTEHNIHATLCMYPDLIVWTGKMGIYALPEWGFERPKMGLYETCYEIVSKRYNDTGKPVEYSFVQSQIHKYRKLVNPNSVFFACYLNDSIDITADKKLLPTGREKAVFIDTEEDYERIEEKLKEFENSFS